MGPVDIHIQRLKLRRPKASTIEVEGSGILITVPEVELPLGWNKTSTEIHFFAPQGYPYAKPDCFWADVDLRLASGAAPQNTGATNPMPGLEKPAIWFSWHTDQWNASRDDLMTWVASINDRLNRIV